MPSYPLRLRTCRNGNRKHGGSTPPGGVRKCNFFSSDSVMDDESKKSEPGRNHSINGRTFFERGMRSYRRRLLPGEP